MKKIIFTALTITLISFSATAQKSKVSSTGKFGFFGAIGTPTGTARKFEGPAFEMGVQGDLPVAPKMNLTGGISYWAFMSKKPYTSRGGVIPAMVGAKGYLTNSLYLHGQIGVGFITSGGPQSTVFVYSPAIGYDLNRHIDVALKLLSATKSGVNESYLGLKLGVSF